ncbi:transposase [Shewanella algae]|nr:transposase [Shewanella algae]
MNPNGQSGCDNQFSDAAITTALMVRDVFDLSLRQTQGFIDSVFSLMGTELRNPTYSSVSKRAKRGSLAIPIGPAHRIREKALAYAISDECMEKNDWQTTQAGHGIQLHEILSQGCVSYWVR